MGSENRVQLLPMADVLFVALETRERVLLQSPLQGNFSGQHTGRLDGRVVLAANQRIRNKVV